MPTCLFGVASMPNLPTCLQGLPTCLPASPAMPCLSTWPSFQASFTYHPNLSAVTALPVGLICLPCLHTLIAYIACLTFALHACLP